MLATRKHTGNRLKTLRNGSNVGLGGLEGSGRGRKLDHSPLVPAGWSQMRV